jgi:hypothetical protein
MSAKALDRHERWRSMTIGVRVSPEENDQVNAMVALSGMTKQDYCIDRMLQHDVVVVANPRVHKALKNQMAQLILEFQRLSDATEISPYTLEVLDYLAHIYNGLKGQ